MLRIQVSPFHPVTFCFHIDHRLIVQTVPGNPGGIPVFSDFLAEAVVSVRQQYFLSVSVEIGFSDRFSCFIQRSFNGCITVGKVHQLAVCPIVFNIYKP